MPPHRCWYSTEALLAPSRYESGSVGWMAGFGKMNLLIFLMAASSAPSSHSLKGVSGLRVIGFGLTNARGDWKS